MIYNKPEIFSLGDAARVIHGMQKTASASWDSLTLNYTFVPAYDLDE